jgi:putative ABC transport system substrate-binding protein
LAWGWANEAARVITVLGGVAVAWPLVARAQQPTLPVIGFLRSSTEDGFGHLVAAFRHGLSENGFADGRNVQIEFRWADDRPERLPALATDLVRRDGALEMRSHISL